jgi:predicted RNase H-like HicB family nuclease
MREFVALIYQGPEGDYRVSFPDFSTITAAGETLERARANAEVALFSHIHRLVAEGQIIPGPLSPRPSWPTLGIRARSIP